MEIHLGLWGHTNLPMPHHWPNQFIWWGSCSLEGRFRFPGGSSFTLFWWLQFHEARRMERWGGFCKSHLKRVFPLNGFCKLLHKQVDPEIHSPLLLLCWLIDWHQHVCHTNPNMNLCKKKKTQKTMKHCGRFIEDSTLSSQTTNWAMFFSWH